MKTIANSRRALRSVLVVCLSVHIGSSAEPITLEDIAAAYSEKFDLLQPYRVRYTETTAAGKLPTVLGDNRPLQEETRPAQPNVGPDRVETRVVEILVDKLRYRKSVWIETAPGGQLVPALIETDNGAEKRLIWYSTSGGRGLGQILAAQAAFTIYNELAFTPIGLAGLHDSSTYFDPGDGGALPFMTDVRALAREPNAVLQVDPVDLNGEQAYVIEWPGNLPHPMHRVWLSAEKNLCLLKCEVYRLNNTGEYAVLTRSVNSDFEEVKPRLYLPKRSTFQALGIEGQTPGQTKELELVSVDLAVPVNEDHFLLDFPEDIHVLRTVFSWGDHKLTVENATFEKIRIFIAVGFLIMLAAIVIFVFRSRRGVR